MKKFHNSRHNQSECTPLRQGAPYICRRCHPICTLFYRPSCIRWLCPTGNGVKVHVWFSCKVESSSSIVFCQFGSRIAWEKVWGSLVPVMLARYVLCVEENHELEIDPAGWLSARALPRHGLPHQLDTTCPPSPHHGWPLWEPEKHTVAPLRPVALRRSSQWQEHPKNWEKICFVGLYWKAHNPSRMSRNENVPLQILLRLPL